MQKMEHIKDGGLQCLITVAAYYGIAVNAEGLIPVSYTHLTLPTMAVV